MSRLFIVEDDFRHRKILKEIVKDLGKKMRQNFIITEVTDFYAFYKQLVPGQLSSTDIYLVDYDLNSKVTGEQIAAAIRKFNADAFIIFVTGNEHKALEIINEGILPSGYITKQDKATVTKQLNDILQFILTKKELTNENIIELKEGSSTLRYYEKDLNYFSTIKGQRYNSFVQLTTHSEMISVPLGEIKPVLPNDFFTEFKSYIINLANLKKIERATGVIEFQNGQKLFLSPRMLDKLNKFYNKWHKEG